MALGTPLKQAQKVGGIAAFGGLLLLTLLGAAGASARAESVLRALQVRVSGITSHPQTRMVGPGTTVKVEQDDESRMGPSAGAFSSMAIDTDKPSSSRFDASSTCTDFCPIHLHATKEVAVP
ncbi:MAG TPA: hypothetical protein VK714_11370 [Myxococcota bacterium]|nr:hypothetical protein [Myxococcota bacterium]